MIDLRQLEQSVGYVALLPKRWCYRGYYKRRIPEIARKFGEQEFSRCHVQAIVHTEQKPKHDFEKERIIDGVRQRLMKMEKDGLVEQTGRKGVGGMIFYRNVL